MNKIKYYCNLKPFYMTFACLQPFIIIALIRKKKLRKRRVRDMRGTSMRNCNQSSI